MIYFVAIVEYLYILEFSFLGNNLAHHTCGCTDEFQLKLVKKNAILHNDCRLHWITVQICAVVKCVSKTSSSNVIHNDVFQIHADQMSFASRINTHKALFEANGSKKIIHQIWQYNGRGARTNRSDCHANHFTGRILGETSSRKPESKTRESKRPKSNSIN